MSRKAPFSHRPQGTNQSLFQRFSRGAALASILGVLVCAQVSCLIPQTVEPIVQAPHPAPYFVVEQIPSYLSPPQLTLIRQGAVDAALAPACHCQLWFDGLFVHEDDPTITLVAKWFVDYDVTNPSSVRPWASNQMDGTFDDPTRIVRSVLTFQFDADAVGIVTSGVHLVEVVIGETNGFDPSSTTQPNRAMKAGYTPAVWRFPVNVRVEQVPGQCNQPPAQSPPSVRVSCP
jgi:hypothetical protein